jgi:DNA polymerase I-like protein with 3'-5' exonuclease and polymerase domains
MTATSTSTTALPPPGRRLVLPQHQGLIDGSGILPAIAGLRGYWSATTPEQLERLGFAPVQRLAPALAIPIYSTTGALAFHQIRPDSPRLGSDGRPVKYETPLGRRPVLDVPQATLPLLGVPTVPLFFTEGARKVDAALGHDLAAMGVLGVWGWRGKNGQRGRTALADFDDIALDGRRVYIVFDSDVATKPEVARAMRRFQDYLEHHGAVVGIVYLPSGPDGAKVGLDDFFVAGGTAEGLLDLAEDGVRGDAVAPPGGAPAGLAGGSRAAPAATVTRLADVVIEPLRWGWRPYIPQGETTLIEGDPDEGKSLITLDLAARFSRGRAMPDGSASDLQGPQHVLVIGDEDRLATTVKPRLLAAGGDPERVHVLSMVPHLRMGSDPDTGDPTVVWEQRLPQWPDDAGRVHRVAEELGATVLILDPLSAHLGEKVNPNSDQSIRAALQATSHWVQRTGRVFLIVRHFNKQSGESNPKYRGAGTIGLLGLARSSLMVAPDPDDAPEAGGAGERRAFSRQKGNLAAAKDSPTWLYTISTTEEGVPYVEWLHKSPHTSRSLLRALDPEDTSTLGEAKRLLERLLADGPRRSDEVEQAAKQLSISPRTLHRARAALGVEPRPVTSPPSTKVDHWLLSLPPLPPEDSTDAAGHGVGAGTAAAATPTGPTALRVGDQGFPVDGAGTILTAHPVTVTELLPSDDPDSGEGFYVTDDPSTRTAHPAEHWLPLAEALAQGLWSADDPPDEPPPASADTAVSGASQPPQNGAAVQRASGPPAAFGNVAFSAPNGTPPQIESQVAKPGCQTPFAATPLAMWLGNVAPDLENGAQTAPESHIAKGEGWLGPDAEVLDAEAPSAARLSSIFVAPAETPEGAEDEPATADVDLSDVQLITTAEALAAAVPALLASEFVGVDTETTGLDPHTDRLRLVQLAAPGQPVVVVDAFACPTLAPLVPLFADQAPGTGHRPTLAGHHLKFDLQILERAGLPLPPGDRLFDTMLAAQLLDAGAHTHTKGYFTLQATAARELGEAGALDKTEQTSDWASPTLSPAQLAYAARDARVLEPLTAALASRLTESKLAPLAAVEFAALPAVAATELAGVPIDTDAWRALAREAEEALPRLRGAVTAQAMSCPSPADPPRPRRAPAAPAPASRSGAPPASKGAVPLQTEIALEPPSGAPQDLPEEEAGEQEEPPSWLDVVLPLTEKQCAPLKSGKRRRMPAREFNPDSHEQQLRLLNALLGPLGHPVTDVKEETLVPLRYVHPVVEALLALRTASKRATAFGSTYVDKYVHPVTGRIHPGYQQVGTEAGRLSCSGPNVQQIPHDAAYRACIAAPLGRVLVKADYTQIELCVVAEVSGDRKLLDALLAGDDLHRLTAAALYQKPAEAVTPDERAFAKIVNFGSLYGQGANGLQAQATTQGLTLSLEGAREMLRSFDAAWPQLARWRRARQNSREPVLITLGGRQRRLRPDAPPTFRLNTPIQGAAADGFKAALGELWATRARCPSGVPVLLVHDEIVVEADEAEAGAAVIWVQDAMVAGMRRYLRTAPVRVEATVSRSWGGAPLPAVALAETTRPESRGEVAHAPVAPH